MKFLAASPLVAETSLVSTDISESNPPQETSKQLDTTITDKVDIIKTLALARVLPESISTGSPFP